MKFEEVLIIGGDRHKAAEAVLANQRYCMWIINGPAEIDRPLLPWGANPINTLGVIYDSVGSP